MLSGPALTAVLTTPPVVAKRSHGLYSQAVPDGTHLRLPGLRPVVGAHAHLVHVLRPCHHPHGKQDDGTQYGISLHRNASFYVLRFQKRFPSGFLRSTKQGRGKGLSLKIQRQFGSVTKYWGGFCSRMHGKSTQMWIERDAASFVGAAEPRTPCRRVGRVAKIAITFPGAVSASACWRQGKRLSICSDRRNVHRVACQ